MAYTITDALLDPLLSAALPQVVSAVDTAGSRPVRWAHASEQLDVAPLLLGGELILMEGIHLANDPAPETLVAYVDSLVEAGVAALAVELSARLAELPVALLQRARECELPIVELHLQVPFVQICQSVNMRLSEQSFHRIQQSDNLSGALTTAAAGGADVVALLQQVADFSGARVTLFRLDGRRVGLPGEDVDDASAPPHAAFSVPLEAAGSPLGTLVLDARVATNIDAVAAALDRAPEILAIALLRSAPPTRRERVVGQLLTHLGGSVGGPSREDVELDLLLRDLGLADRGGRDEAFLSLRLDVGPRAEVARGVIAALDTVSGRNVAQLHGDTLVAVLSLDSHRLEQARERLRAVLDDVVGPGVTACLGSGVQGAGRLAAEHQTVMSYLSWAGRGTGRVWDAREFQLRRLTLALEGDAAVAAFCDEVLGVIARSPELLRTLTVYAAVWGNKTAAAKELGIGRQTLYDRLARLESELGPLDASLAHNAATITAALLAGADTFSRSRGAVVRRRRET